MNKIAVSLGIIFVGLILMYLSMPQIEVNLNAPEQANIDDVGVFVNGAPREQARVIWGESTVSVNAPEGYSIRYGGHCNEDGTVRLGLYSTALCTVTLQAPEGILIVRLSAGSEVNMSVDDMIQITLNGEAVSPDSPHQVMESPSVLNVQVPETLSYQLSPNCETIEVAGGETLSCTITIQRKSQYEIDGTTPRGQELSASYEVQYLRGIQNFRPVFVWPPCDDEITQRMVESWKVGQNDCARQKGEGWNTAEATLLGCRQITGVYDEGAGTDQHTVADYVLTCYK